MLIKSKVQNGTGPPSGSNRWCDFVAWATYCEHTSRVALCNNLRPSFCFPLHPYSFRHGSVFTFAHICGQTCVLYVKMMVKMTTMLKAIQLDARRQRKDTQRVCTIISLSSQYEAIFLFSLCRGTTWQTIAERGVVRWREPFKVWWAPFSGMAEARVCRVLAIRWQHSP